MHIDAYITTAAADGSLIHVTSLPFTTATNNHKLLNHVSWMALRVAMSAECHRPCMHGSAVTMLMHGRAIRRVW